MSATIDKGQYAELLMGDVEAIRGALSDVLATNNTAYVEKLVTQYIPEKLRRMDEKLECLSAN